MKKDQFVHSFKICRASHPVSSINSGVKQHVYKAVIAKTFLFLCQKGTKLLLRWYEQRVRKMTSSLKIMRNLPSKF